MNGDTLIPKTLMSCSPSAITTNNGINVYHQSNNNSGLLWYNTTTNGSTWNGDTQFQINSSGIVSNYYSLPNTGKEHDLSMKISFIENAVSHIQGMGFLNNQYSFTHNQESGYGYMGILDTNNNLNKYYLKVDGDNFKYQHPGGFQVCNDYVAIGFDKTENYHPNDPSVVNIYTIDAIIKGQNPICTINRPNTGAASTGFTFANNNYYLAVYHSGQINVYVSSNIANGFSLLFTATTLAHGYDNLNLVTDTNNNIYLFGFDGEISGPGGAFCVDNLDLYQIDLTKNQLNFIGSRKMNPGSTQSIRPQFRYGACVVVSNNSITVYCCQRNFITILEREIIFKTATFTSNLQ